MIRKLDVILFNFQKRQIGGFKRFILEFWFFGVKQARACLFAGIFFIAMFCVPKEGLFGIYRYACANWNGVFKA